MDTEKQKKEINKLENLKTLEHTRKRTIEDKTFPSLKLFWELGDDYRLPVKLTLEMADIEFRKLDTSIKWELDVMDQEKF